MLGGGDRFQLGCKEPLALRVIGSLLFVNTVLMLALEFGGKYFLPKQAPHLVSWYLDHSILIQFIIMALLVSIFVIFRKRVRWTGPKYPATVPEPTLPVSAVVSIRRRNPQSEPHS